MIITKVTDRLFRGAHPLTVQDLAQLKAQGIDTILNLERGWFELFHGRLNWETIMGIMAGMTVIHLQLADVFAPEPMQLDAALDIIRDPKYGKVYVHCLHGVDRTGEVCAAERVKVEGWSADSAIAEMFSFGYHQMPYRYLWLPSFRRYLSGG